MASLIAVTNQKGGVGKTTTVHSLGYALARLDRRVLLVDLDPQACLTYSVGLDTESLNNSVFDVLLRRKKAVDVQRAVTGERDLSILPATLDLAGAEVHLVTRPGREYVLARALQQVSDDYDFVLIDCPPSLGVLTINALTAADSVLVPLQCETLARRGLGQLLEMIDEVREFTNNKLAVRGVIVTMYESRTRHDREVLAEVTARYGLSVLGPPVPRSIRFAEAPLHSRCIIDHAPMSPGAGAYREIARQLAEEACVEGRQSEPTNTWASWIPSTQSLDLTASPQHG